MPFTVIIPARFASTRLRGKPLLDIAGKPMIQHVYERACQSQAARVVIATDSEAVQKVAAGFGAEVCMTSERHESGTDRLQEAASQLGLLAHDLVVNVQGDEPMIPPAVIDQVAANLGRHAEASIATLCEPITELEQLLDPNIVKVVMDEQGLALYFSRAPIPWPRDEFRSMETLASHRQLPPAIQFFRHIGIYGYRVQLLHDFVTWPLGKLEAVERLEQLRAMEHGHRIHIMPSVEAIPPGVDTERDLQRVREVLEGRV